MPEVKPLISVIVLNWNGRKLIEELMPNWLRYTADERVVFYLADNNSEDDSLAFVKAHYPDVKVMTFPVNYGFADGYNQAIRLIDTPYVMLLNSDAALSEGWLDEPLSLLASDQDIVAVQPKIRAYFEPEKFEYAGAVGGFIDRWGYPYCMGRILDEVEYDKGQYDSSSVEIFWASGAAMIIRTEAYLEVGGLDHRFFAHQEEIDLCWRLKARGMRIVNAPSSVVYHMGGATLDMKSPRKTYLNYRNNLLMLYKNLPKSKLRKVMMMRVLLDYMSILVFIIKGEIALAKAAYQARRDFRVMKKDFVGDRAENLSFTKELCPKGIVGLSIVWQFFVRKHKHYTDLPRQ